MFRSDPVGSDFYFDQFGQWEPWWELPRILSPTQQMQPFGRLTNSPLYLRIRIEWEQGPPQLDIYNKMSVDNVLLCRDPNRAVLTPPGWPEIFDFAPFPTAVYLNPHYTDITVNPADDYDYKWLLYYGTEQSWQPYDAALAAFPSPDYPPIDDNRDSFVDINNDPDQAFIQRGWGLHFYRRYEFAPNNPLLWFTHWGSWMLHPDKMEKGRAGNQRLFDPCIKQEWKFTHGNVLLGPHRLWLEPFNT